MSPLVKATGKTAKPMRTNHRVTDITERTHRDATNLNHEKDRRFPHFIIVFSVISETLWSFCIWSRVYIRF